MSTLGKAIGMGAKVSVAEGDGVVVGLTHTQPMYFDILLLETGKTVSRRPEPDVKLIDSYPVDDPAIPADHRDWIKTRPTIRTNQTIKKKPA